jgi:thioredoxin-like negative regulator of GroEL
VATTHRFCHFDLYSEASIMSLVRTLFTLSATVVLVGCQDVAAPQTVATPRLSVPYVTAAGLATAIAEQDRLVLIEFCVPVGCFRCDEMRPQIDRLASDKGNEIVIRRVDLNRERALAAQHGVTMCPSYIALIDGQEVFRAAYPTSGDLIYAELENALQPSSKIP